MKSRRGGRRRAAGVPPASLPEPAAPRSTSDQDVPYGFPTPPVTGMGSRDSIASSQSGSPGSHFEYWNDDDAQPISERLIGVYYRFFHHAHPCSLPQKFLQPYQATNAPGIELLIAVMQYIGSLYAPKVASEPWREQCEVTVRSLLPRSSLFEVQALILYAITAQWTNYSEYSHTLMNLAIDRSLAIGLYDRDFATRNAAKQSVYAESCRRTWWELYLSELSMAAIDRRNFTRLNHRSINPTVDMPCSEEEYESGIIPEPRTLDEWEQREFADEVDTAFSSFTYFIGLYRSFEYSLVGKPRDREEAVRSICTAADAGVAAFKSFCSSTSRSLVCKNGALDMYIFKANFGAVV